MAVATNEVDEIRRQMAQIRHELHQDVREVVAGAEAVADWRRYIRSYPWVAVGTAFAVGYLVVPRRHKAGPTVVAVPSDLTKVREAVKEAAQTVEQHPRKSLLAGAFGVLAPVVVRAAQGYAINYLEHWAAQVMQQRMAATGGPPPGPQSPTVGPERPGRAAGK